MSLKIHFINVVILFISSTLSDASIVEISGNDFIISQVAGTQGTTSIGAVVARSAHDSTDNNLVVIWSSNADPIGYEFLQATAVPLEIK